MRRVAWAFFFFPQQKIKRHSLHSAAYFLPSHLPQLSTDNLYVLDTIFLLTPLLSSTMPYASERKQLIRDIELAILLSYDDDDDDIVEELVQLHDLFTSSRFINCQTKRTRDDHFFRQKFELLNDIEFKSTFRTTKAGFIALVQQLENHPVFYNNSTCKQLAPQWQIAITLARFGGAGNGSSVMGKQVLTGLSAGTIVNCTERVITAILSVTHEWIRWPDARRRREICEVMSLEGFPGCIGFVDGTTIPLSQKPALDGETYYDRKCRYGDVPFLLF